MCGISLERLKEIVTDQDHEEFLVKLQAAVMYMEIPYYSVPAYEHSTMMDDYLL